MRRSTLYLKAQRLAPLTFVVGAVACTPMLSTPPDFDVRPVSTQPSADARADQGYYQNAVNAIKQRDYGVALNFLQAARAQENDSARVLNAFGVVYDKLGRFDLSARYYERARAADPQSTIVAGNIAYSHVLQQLLNGDITPKQLASAVSEAKPPVVMETQTIIAPDVEMKPPQLAMAPIEARSASPVTALSLPDLNLGTATSDGIAATNAPQLALASLAPRTASFPALPLPELKLDVDAGDEAVAAPAPQLAVSPIEPRPALSLAAMPLTHFDFGTDSGSKTSDTQRPAREAAATPLILPAPEAHFAVTLRSESVAEIELLPKKSQDIALPPGLLVVDGAEAGSRASASKPVAPQMILADGLGTPQAHAEAPAVPSEYLPLFLPDTSIRTAPRVEVQKIEDVPQYRAQLAADFSTDRPEKAVAHAAEVNAAAVKWSAVALRTAPMKYAGAAKPTASWLPVRTAVLTHPVSAPGNTGRATNVASAGILTHHPVVIVNASTKKNADDPIRVTLARRNWSIAHSHGTDLHKLTYTTLFYAQVDYPVARALARTLTFPIRLVPDSCHCAGLRLVVGDNALPRNAAELHGTSSAQAGSSVAGVLAGTLQGARGW